MLNVEEVRGVGVKRGGSEGLLMWTKRWKKEDGVSLILCRGTLMAFVQSIDDLRKSWGLHSVSACGCSAE